MPTATHIVRVTMFYMQVSIFWKVIAFIPY